MNRLPVALAALALLVAAALLRLWGVAERPLWLDESWSRWMVEQDWRALIDSARLYDAHPPFYYLLLKSWSVLFSTSALGLRLVSVLAGLAMLPLAWACARRIGLERAGTAALIAATALSPVLIVASRQARPYALFALAFAVALHAALGLIRGQWRTSRQRTLAWLAYFAGIELVMWLHGLGLFFAASLGGGLLLACWKGGRLRQEWRAFTLVHAGALAAWIPCLLILLRQRQAWDDTWLRFAWGDILPGLGSGLAAPGVIGLAVVAAGAGAAMLLARRHELRPPVLLLAACTFGPALLAILYSAVATPIFLPRTLAPSALPLLLLAITGIERLRARALRAGLMLVVPLLLGFAAAAQVLRPPEEKWDQLVRWLEPRIGTGDEVWLLPNELVLPLTYGGGSALSVRGIPAPFPAPDHPSPRYSGTRAVPAMDDEDAARLVADARRRNASGIWLVSRFGPWFDRGASLNRALGAPSSREIRFAPLLIEHYRLATIPPRG
ncbi:MAG: hypothetical protein ACT4OE_04065 [Sphingosinicella sp.]